MKPMKHAAAALSLLGLCLVLAACGSKQKTKTQAIEVNNRLSQEVFVEKCRALNGVIANNDPNLCMASMITSLESFSDKDVDIDPSFDSGKFIVTTGNPEGSVDVRLSSTEQKVAGIPDRRHGPQGQSGKLYFNVYGKAHYHVTATIWTCYGPYEDSSKNLNRVGCAPLSIP